MLPKIQVGGFEFYNMAGIIAPDRFVRPRTEGGAFHHTVGVQQFKDLNFNGTNMDEEIAHIKAIDAMDLWGGGFPYNGIVFESGRVYVAGLGLGARTHVANKNHILEGLVWAGTYSVVNPPPGILLGSSQWWAAKRVQHPGLVDGRGHRNWVSDPAWATACPGDNGVRWVPQILAGAEALLRERIAKVLTPPAMAGDIETLAGMIAYLTGGKLCG